MLIESHGAVRRPFNSGHSKNKKGHRDAVTFFVRGGGRNCPSGLNILFRPFGPGQALSLASLLARPNYALK
jgi:hypothetical protein